MRAPQGCSCPHPRELLALANAGQPFPPCDVHRPEGGNPDPEAVALNDDQALAAKISRALGTRITTTTEL